MGCRCVGSFQARPAGSHRDHDSAQNLRATAHHGGVHELSLCQAIVSVVRSAAQGRHVEVVRVRVGALRQVVPESLEFCWSLLREHEDLGDAELELELVSGEVVCRTCRQRSQIDSRWSVCCPACESSDVEVTRGSEFLVTSLDVT